MPLGERLRRLDQHSLNFSESRRGRWFFAVVVTALIVVFLIIQWRKWGIGAAIALGIYFVLRFFVLDAWRRRRAKMSDPDAHSH